MQDLYFVYGWRIELLSRMGDRDGAEVPCERAFAVRDASPGDLLRLKRGVAGPIRSKVPSVGAQLVTRVLGELATRL